MGAFLNEFDANLQTGIIVFIVLAAPTFGYFYNRLMDGLPENEHTSLYVAIGVAVSIGFIALVSWKAALLALVVFILDGLPMIAGEFRRTLKKARSTPRRKRLPYAANGLLDDARMASTEAHRLIGKALQAETLEEIYKNLAGVGHELTTITTKISEVKQIQADK